MWMTFRNDVGNYLLFYGLDQTLLYNTASSLQKNQDTEHANLQI